MEINKNFLDIIISITSSIIAVFFTVILTLLFTFFEIKKRKREINEDLYELLFKYVINRDSIINEIPGDLISEYQFNITDKKDGNYFFSSSQSDCHNEFKIYLTNNFFYLKSAWYRIGLKINFPYSEFPYPINHTIKINKMLIDYAKTWEKLERETQENDIYDFILNFTDIEYTEKLEKLFKEKYRLDVWKKTIEYTISIITVIVALMFMLILYFLSYYGFYSYYMYVILKIVMVLSIIILVYKFIIFFCDKYFKKIKIILEHKFAILVSLFIILYIIFPFSSSNFYVKKNSSEDKLEKIMRDVNSNIKNLDYISLNTFVILKEINNNLKNIYKTMNSIIQESYKKTNEKKRKEKNGNFKY